MVNRTFEALFLKQLSTVASIALVFAFVACTGLDGKDGVAGADGRDGRDGVAGLNGKDGADGLNGKDGVDGKDAVVNVDSLADAIKKELMNSLKDSLNVNSSSSTGENNPSIISTLQAKDLGTENVYGAFANHYALMYEDFSIPNENGDSITIQSPFPIGVANICETNNACNSKKIMIKTWIPGFSDTATITEIIAPDTAIYLSPMLNFNDKALLALTSAKKTQRQIEAYALEKDQKILFYSESKPITIHPMQVFGLQEPAFLTDSISFAYRGYWYSVWVTPMADSISRIVNEVAKKLPNGELLVYQQYEIDESVEQSSWRVVAAVFEVLQSRNIKYVQNTGAGSIGQRINYPVETLRKKQGLCIETAVLFASVLERVGFQTALIITPNHAFVGWISEPNEGSITYIETTWIGNKDYNAYDAMIKGIEEHNEQIELGNFESGNSLIVPIYAARLLGITPNNIP